MPKTFIIKNATLVHPGHKFHLKKIDLQIDNHKILAIGKKLKVKGKEIEGKDLHVSVGWHDMRTHLSDPGKEHKDDLLNTLNSAAAGGFTSISTLPNSLPPVDSKSIVKYLKEKASSHLVELFPYGSISDKLENKNLSEMYDMANAGAVAFTDGDTTPSSAMLKKALLYGKSFNAKIISLPMDDSLHQHAHVNESENTIHTGLKSSSSLAEYTVVAQHLEIAKYCEAAIHFTGITCKESVEMIRKAKRAGQAVTCDTSIFNLCFSDKEVMRFDENFKVYPLLRTEKDRKALVKAVYEGVIDVVCSNHCPQNVELKEVEFDYADFGALSHQLILAWYVEHLAKSMDITSFISALAQRPRKVLGLEQPSLELNNIANLCVFDLQAEWTFNKQSNKSLSQNTHEWGQDMLGKVVAIFNNKQVNLY